MWHGSTYYILIFNFKTLKFKANIVDTPMTIVLPDTKIGNLMTDKGMSVGLLVSVIGHTVGI